jgi:hypothetical protein
LKTRRGNSTTLICPTLRERHGGVNQAGVTETSPN